MFNDYPASILLACKIEIQEKWRKRRRLPWYDGNKKKYRNDKKIVRCPVCPKREIIDRSRHSSVWIYNDILEDKNVAVKILFYNDYDNFITKTNEIEYLNKLKKRDNIV